jgi:hypothetical protein
MKHAESFLTPGTVNLRLGWVKDSPNFIKQKAVYIDFMNGARIEQICQKHKITPQTALQMIESEKGK